MKKSRLLLALLGLVAACGGKLTVDRDEPGEQAASGGVTSTNVGGSHVAGSASSTAGGPLGDAGVPSLGGAATNGGAANVAGEAPLGAGGESTGTGEGGAAATVGEAGSAGASSCHDAQDCGLTPCTNLACGGSCPLCETGRKCLTDGDCRSGACDADTQTCVDDHCKDHHQNFGETDADCGVTGNCAACKLGQGCYWNIDCSTNACDSDTRVCVSSQCVDHQVDGDESDYDCGGGVCPGCPNYEKCKSSFDCADGLCSISLPHLCTP